MADKTNAIKTRIEVDGEREYRQACQNINTSLKTLGSEMKVISAAYAGNEDSIEALTAKQKNLQAVFAEQSKRVEEAQKALDNLKANGFDDTNATVQKFQQNLNNATAAMLNTGNQIKDMDAALENAQKPMDEIGDEAGKTGDELKKLDKDLESNKEKWGKLADGIAAGAKAFAVGVAAIGTAATAAAGALVKLTVDGGKYADDLLTQSTYTRQTTDDLQKYAYACNFVDTDMEKLTGSMTKNIKSMKSAADGSAAAAEAYAKIGVAVTNADGSLRDSNEVYWEAIDALKEIENETERDALAMQLFGKSGTELNSIINAGSAAFKAYGDEAVKMGAVMSGESLAALGAFDDKMQQLTAGLGGLKNSASLIALPFLDDLAGKGVDILADFGSAVNAAEGDVPKMAAAIGDALSGVLGLITDGMPEFIDMGVNMITSLISGINKSIPKIAASASMVLKTLVNGLTTALPMLIDGATKMIAWLARGLGAALPELIPQTVDMIMTIVQGLIDNIPMLITAALQLVTGLADGLVAAIPVLIEALPELIDSIINGIMTAIPQIIEAGIELFVSLVDALPEIITQIVAVLPKIIDSIVTALIENLPILVNAGLELFTALVGALPEIILTIVNAMPQIITAITDALTDNLPLLIDTGVQLFMALIDNMPEILKGLADSVPTIITAIIDAFVTAIPKMFEMGKNLIQGLWEGIKDVGAWLGEKISGFFGGVVDDIKKFFGIASPSKLMAKLGGFMGEGVGVGFEAAMKTVTKDMENAIPKSFDMPALDYGISAARNISTNIAPTAVNSTAYGVSQSQAKNYTISIPVVLNGKEIAKAVTMIQVLNNDIIARNKGVVVA
jgi:phage-related protein